MKTLWKANFRAFRKISIMIIVSMLCLSCSLNVLHMMLNFTNLALRSRQIDLYGEQHVVFLHATEQQTKRFRENAGIIHQEGRVIPYGSVAVNDDSILIGAFDDQAWMMSHIQLTSGSVIKASDEILMEEAVWQHYFPNVPVGSTVQLLFASPDGTTRELTCRLSGIVNTYTSIWQEQYNTWPPQEHVFPNIICSQSLFPHADHDLAFHWLVQLQDDIMPVLLRDRNEFMKASGLTWCVNRNAYANQLNAYASAPLERLLTILPTLIWICAGLTSFHLFSEHQNARGTQHHALYEIGMNPIKIKLFSAFEYCFLVMGSTILGAIMSPCFCYLILRFTGGNTQAFSWDSFISTERFLSNNMILVLVMMGVALLKALIPSEQRTFHTKRTRTIHRLPVLLFLAVRHLRNHLLGYVSGIAHTAIVAFVILLIHTLLPIVIQAELEDRADYAVGVLADSYVLPYTEDAKLPVHVGQRNELPEDLVKALEEIPSVSHITYDSAVYDMIIAIPNTYVRDSDGWLRYDMTPTYERDAYTYKRSFQSGFNVMDVKTDDPDERWITNTVAAFDSVNIDMSKVVCFSSSLLSTDEDMPTVEGDAIPCHVIIGSSSIFPRSMASSVTLQPGDQFMGYYFENLAGIEAIDLTTVFDQQDLDAFAIHSVCFEAASVAYQPESAYPILIYLSQDGFDHLDLGNRRQRINLFLDDTETADMIHEIIKPYISLAGGTLYQIDRSAVLEAQRAFNLFLRSVLLICNSLLLCSGVLQMAFAYSLRIKSRKEEWHRYWEIGLSKKAILFLKSSDILFVCVGCIGCYALLLIVFFHML